MKLQLMAWAGALSFASATAHAEPIPLEALLADTQHAVGVLQAETALDGARHELQRDRAQKGWQFTGAIGYGAIRNIVDENRALSYPAAQGQLGFSYPLLGASEQRQRAVDSAAGKVQEKKARLAEARQRAPLELESNYARYWGAQEATAVVDAYLASEATLGPRLRLRQQKKLMLESRLLDLLSGYSGAHSDRAQLLRAREQTRSRLTQLTGRPLAEFVALPVILPTLPDSIAKDALAHHPDLAALDAQADALEAQLGNSSWYGMDAAFNVMASANSDQRDHQTGGTAFVGFNFSAPLSLISMRREERQRLQSELDAVRLQRRQRSDELDVEARAALGRLAQDSEAMEVAAQKTRAAAAALRERQLRSGVFSEEGIEALSQQLRDYTTQALADIDTRVKAWQANIEARGYLEAAADKVAVPGSADSALGAQLAEPLTAVAGRLRGAGGGQAAPATESGNADAPRTGTRMSSAVMEPTAPGDVTAAIISTASTARAYELPSRLIPGLQQVAWQAQVASPAPAVLVTAAAANPRLALADSLSTADTAPPGPGMAVYVWNSRELIAHNQFQPAFWKLLGRLAIRRLLISLDGGQIRSAQAQPQALRDFLRKARDNGVTVDLLLGEPSWIEAAHRQDLINLIGKMRGFEFAGLHLDIEPDQLYKQPLSRAQFDDWVTTINAAAKSAPWPTSVSVHPRYFRDPPYRDWKLAELLRNDGVSEVALMIFSSDARKVAAVALPILADAPEMRFRIAQSVEPQLDQTLSHARRSPEDFEAAMRELQRQLSAQANADGIVVQAWADLMRMGYESQIR